MVCCGKPMDLQKEGMTDGSLEKHVPVIEKKDNGYLIKVGSVPHPMLEEHYIEWISLVTDNKEYTVNLYPEQNAECRFKYIPGSKIYAYCNKHGLWCVEVK